MRTSVRAAFVALAVPAVLLSVPVRHCYAGNGKPKMENKDALALGSLSAASFCLGPVFGGGYEVGTAIGALLFWDPPDAGNACTAVNLTDYTSFQMPDVQSTCPVDDAGLTTDVNTALHEMNQFVALVRADRAAHDRYTGAVLSAVPGCADDRLSQWCTFRQQLQSLAPQIHTALDTYITDQNAVDPSVLSTTIPKSDVKTVVGQLAMGSFPSVDNQAVSSYQPTSSEIQIISRVFQALTDPVIDSLFLQEDPPSGASVTLGFVMNTASSFFADSSNFSACTPFATPAATSNSPVCEGAPIALSASEGGTSYMWSGPGGFTSTDRTLVILDASAANAGTYTVTITYADGYYDSYTATADTFVAVTSSCACVAPATVAMIPPSGSVTLCEQLVAKKVAKLGESFMHCHRNRARGLLPNEAAEESCEDSAVSKFLILNVSGCSSCMDLTQLSTDVRATFDSLVNEVYCDPTTGMPLDPD